MYPTNPMHCIQQFRGATASRPRCAGVIVILLQENGTLMALIIGLFLQETDTVMALPVELWRNLHCLFQHLQGSGGWDAWGVRHVQLQLYSPLRSRERRLSLCILTAPASALHTACSRVQRRSKPLSLFRTAS
jgi:hypothetical protein